MPYLALFFFFSPPTPFTCLHAQISRTIPKRGGLERRHVGPWLSIFVKLNAWTRGVAKPYLWSFAHAQHMSVQFSCQKKATLRRANG